MLAATAVAADPEVQQPGPPWTSQHLLDHPLVGKLWHPATGDFTNAQALVAALGGAEFVLLGEKHDNADHHRFQAWVAQQLLNRSWRPAIALEMISIDQEPVLAKYRAANPGDAAGVGEALSWQETGWPEWSLYLPIVEPFMASGLPILPASLSKAALRQVMRQGVESLDPERVDNLGLGSLPDTSVLEAMQTEIVAAHCNQLPETMVEPMVTATLVKDAVMAGALISGASRDGMDGAVLVAGNGHVRLDRGVPWHLSGLSPGSEVLSIGLIEVSESKATPEAYATFFNTHTLPFDFVWFSPRADVQDPCEKYAESLQRARDQHDGTKGGPERE